MSIEENEALAFCFFQEVSNEGNLDLLDEILSPDFIDHNPLPGAPPGPEGAKQFVAMMHTAFPDMHVTIEDVIATEDKVVVRVTVGGTHLGFLGQKQNGMADLSLPSEPSGKYATWTEIHIGRIANGKVVEHWYNVDVLGMVMQLGLIPSAVAVS
ncbi:MAG TPA: ester cyclase [Ktedonobacteraceae bacterium]|nr:ester cyclase [Ktedonobacteraceae bacterium]